MGNNSLVSQEYDIIKNYHKTDWFSIQNHNNQQLWRNKHTNQIASVFKLYQYPSIQDLKRFQCRSIQQQLVKVIHIALQDNYGICVNQSYVHLLIEYIPIKLQMTFNLDLQEGLTILLSVLKGFSYIQRNFGPIQPSMELIGFNQEGKAKVWLNKQYNLNFPQKQIGGYVRSTQQQRVKKIFQIIQRSMINGIFTLNFRKEFMNRFMKYNEAIRFVEQFALNNDLSLKRYIRMDIALRRSQVKGKSRLVRPNINRSMTIVQQNGSSLLNQQRYINVNRPHMLKRISSQDGLIKNNQTITKYQNNISMINIKRDSMVSQGNQFNQNKYSNNQSTILIPKISFTKNRQSVQTNSNIHSNQVYQREVYHHPNVGNFHKKNISFDNLSLQHSSSPFPVKQQIINNNLINQPKKNVQNQSIIEMVKQNKQLQAFNKKSLNQNKQVYRNGSFNYDNNDDKDKDLMKDIEIQKGRHTQSQIQIDFGQNQNISVNNQQLKIQSQLQHKNHDEKDSQNKLQQQISSNLNNYQDIQTSGMFKSINQQDNEKQPQAYKDLQNRQRNFKYIQESQYRLNQYYNQSQIIQQFQQNSQKVNENGQVVKNEQLPINFESFAPDKTRERVIFVSFAPMDNINQDHAEFSQSINAVITSKSLQYADKKQNASLLQTQKHIYEKQQPISSDNQFQTAKMIINQQHPESRPFKNKQFLAQVSNSDVRYQQQSSDIRRDSFANETISIRKFYQNYTQIQSHLDITKKGSLNYYENDLQQVSNKSKDKKIQNNIKKQDKMVKIAQIQQQNRISNNKRQERTPIKSVHSVYQQEQQVFSNKKEQKQIKNNKRQINKSNISEKQQQDFLDVNYLQKSLASKYNSKQSPSNKNNKPSQEQEDDILNINKLQQGLIKFSNSKASIKKSQKDTQRSAPSQFNVMASIKIDKKSNQINDDSKKSNFSAFKQQKNINQAKNKVIQPFYGTKIDKHISNKQILQQYRQSQDYSYTNYEHSTGLQYNNLKNNKKSVQMKMNPLSKYQNQFYYTNNQGFEQIKRQRKIENNDFSFTQNLFEYPYVNTSKYNDYTINRHTFGQNDDYKRVISQGKAKNYQHKSYNDTIDQKYRKYVENNRKGQSRFDKYQYKDQKSQIINPLSRKSSQNYFVDDNKYSNLSYKSKISNQRRYQNVKYDNQSSKYNLNASSKMNLSPIMPKQKDSRAYISYENLRSLLQG